MELIINKLNQVIMPRIIVACIMLAFSLSLTMTACNKNSKTLIDAPNLTDFPVVKAGNDTSIYYPNSSYTLNGSGSRATNSVIKSYKWKFLDGPSIAVINDSLNVTSAVTNLINVGYYSFELTVNASNNLSAKDTINIAVLAPECNTSLAGIIFKDMTWNTGWMMEIDIEKIYSLLPPGSQLKNIYIKRDGSPDWENVVPLNTNSPDYTYHTWIFGNDGLAIYPKNDDGRFDTPDVKIEYCP